jgi:NADH-quinone oxidoreductase subunit H
VPGLFEDGFHLFGRELHLPHIVVVLLRSGLWGGKILLLCWVQLLIRWTLPRFRPDQLMRLGWKQLLPASLLNIVLTAAWVLWQSARR